MPPVEPCNIVAVGKRRDGGTRYWCLRHRADATAKYGLPSQDCRYSKVAGPRADQIFHLDIRKFKGGVGLWGAVPPVYDTTRRPLDRGIHVHAREFPNGEKCIDQTFLEVQLSGDAIDAKISDLDAIYFMVSSVFGFSTRAVTCSICGHSHLDRDWFSVHPHARHLCAACGRHFRDTERAIGNPVARARITFGYNAARPRRAQKGLRLQQAEFEGGLQIWGSNPAIVWTSRTAEADGIHVHAYRKLGDEQPAIDETFAHLEVDGLDLDAEMVRTLMAQRALPHLSGRIVDLRCHSCGYSRFCGGESAFTPAIAHKCTRCRKVFTNAGRLKKVIGNPLLGVLAELAAKAVRPPQAHDLELIPETI